MAKQLINIGDTFTEHQNADGERTCSLCGQRKNLTAEVWANHDNIIIDWRLDWDFEDHLVFSICRDCGFDRFTEQAVSLL